MSGLGTDQIVHYLSLVASLKPGCRFYDVHVHPYEVLFDQFRYQEEPSPGARLALPGRCYTAPSVMPLEFSVAVNLRYQGGSQRLREISQMLMKRIYGCIGERVFLDQMQLSGIDTLLLLSVPAESATEERFDERMQWVKRLYQDQERFWIAGSVPPSVKGEEIADCLAGMKKRFGIAAAKCHSVVSGIDLGSRDGKEWLEMLLASCRQLELPLILHGGKHNPYWGGARGDFGALEHLRDIDFSASAATVVLAHAGFHHCGADEVASEGLPVLQRMLDRHPTLHVDLSGLEYEALKLVLQSVDPERILFGSDALYYRQWEVVATTLHAMAELGMKLEENFVRFASTNPEKIIFKGTSHAEQHQNQVESVHRGSVPELPPRGCQESGVGLGAVEPGSGPGLP